MICLVSRFLVDRHFIPNLNCFHFAVFWVSPFKGGGKSNFLSSFGCTSVWIDPYQKPHQVSKVNSLWSIKDNVVKGSRQNRLVSSVEGLAL